MCRPNEPPAVEKDAPHEITRPEPEPLYYNEGEQHMIEAVMNDPFYKMLQDHGNSTYSLSWFIFLEMRIWWFTHQDYVRNGGTILQYFENMGRDGALQFFRQQGAPAHVSRVWRRVYFGPEPREPTEDPALLRGASYDFFDDGDSAITFDDADVEDYYLVPLFMERDEEGGGDLQQDDYQMSDIFASLRLYFMGQLEEYDSDYDDEVFT